MRLLSALAVTATLAFAVPASATQVFFDGFEGDAPGLSYTSLANWTVFIGSTVDIVAPSNPYGIVVSSPASGNVLDLDGTPGPAGIQTILSFGFGAGDLVTLSFDVGGAQRGSPSDYFATGFLMDASLASNIVGTGLTSAPAPYVSQVSEGIFLTGSTAFTSSSISFVALGSGSLKLAFYTDSEDNVGPLIDNVRLSVGSVPEPATWAMMLAGVAAVGASMRRRKVAVRYAL